MILLLFLACFGTSKPDDNQMSAAEAQTIADLAGCVGSLSMPECQISTSRTSFILYKAEDRWAPATIDGKPGKYLGRFSEETDHTDHGLILEAINEAGGCSASAPCKVTGTEMPGSGHFTLYINGDKKVRLCVKNGNFRKMQSLADQCQ